MTYTQQTWVDGSGGYPLSAARMTHIEEGIASFDTAISALSVQVSQLSLIGVGGAIPSIIDGGSASSTFTDTGIDGGSATG